MSEEIPSSLPKSEPSATPTTETKSSSPSAAISQEIDSLHSELNETASDLRRMWNNGEMSEEDKKLYSKRAMQALNKHLHGALASSDIVALPTLGESEAKVDSMLMHPSPMFTSEPAYRSWYSWVPTSLGKSIDSSMRDHTRVLPDSSSEDIGDNQEKIENPEEKKPSELQKRRHHSTTAGISFFAPDSSSITPAITYQPTPKVLMDFLSNDQLLAMDSAIFTSLICNKHSVTALSEGLITIDQINAINNVAKLDLILTSTGLDALREHRIFIRNVIDMSVDDLQGLSNNEFSPHNKTDYSPP